MRTKLPTELNPYVQIVSDEPGLTSDDYAELLHSPARYGAVEWIMEQIALVGGLKVIYDSDTDVTYYYPMGRGI
jgi:hypothetical protein